MTPDRPGGLAGGTPARVRVDPAVAHQARVYDYWLGGKDNFAADREAAEEAVAAYPPILPAVRAQRAFLARAVRYLAGQAGVRQFLDIGTGLPTASNTHEVAQAAAPEARVVYVDNDPMVLAHARALLTGTPQGATRYLDADDPHAIVARLTEALPSGSWLGIYHPASDIDQDRVAEAVRRVNARSAGTTTLRSHAQIARFFDGLHLLEPGLVQVHRWQPGWAAPGNGDQIAAYAGLARTP